MDPERIAKWFPVFRDFAIVCVALGLLIFETVFRTPNAVAFGLIGSLLMGPAWVRFNNSRKKDDDES